MNQGLNRMQLKILAAIAMVFDNAYLRFYTVFPTIIHLLTRFVAPLFAWLMVDGFFHTQSKKKYMLRLWVAAVCMQVGNIITFMLFHQKGIVDNIFMTLAVSFTIIWLFENAKNYVGGQKVKYLILAWGLTVLGLLLSTVLFIPLPFDYYLALEGGLQLIPFVLFSYFFHGNITKQSIAVLLYSFLLFFTLYGGAESISQGFDMFCMNSDWMTFLVIPFLFLYNGQEGKKRKGFFYAFYPIHLWILMAIDVFL